MRARSPLTCLCAFALPLAFGCSSRPEPTFEGRALTLWMFSLESPHAAERRRGCEAVAAMGPAAEEAIPKLIPLLRDAEADVQLAAKASLVRVGPAAVRPLEEVLEGSDLIARLHGAVALVQILPTHERGMAVIIESFTGLGNPTLAENARQAVIGLGPLVVPRLQLLLRDAYLPVRLAAIEALGSMGSKAQGATQALIDQLSDKEPNVRRAALRALARVGPTDRAVPAIAGLTHDADPSVVSTALEMLTYFPDVKPPVRP